MRLVPATAIAAVAIGAWPVDTEYEPNGTLFETLL